MPAPPAPRSAPERPCPSRRSSSGLHQYRVPPAYAYHAVGQPKPTELGWGALQTKNSPTTGLTQGAVKCQPWLSIVALIWRAVSLACHKHADVYPCPDVLVSYISRIDEFGVIEPLQIAWTSQMSYALGK
ncbi:DUF6980 family protein [Halomonas sp. MA07-2]|uniref:DUF6980 family protein n=1 Tax=Halomonas sp. MA07-2 TaxID=3440841 RepID=UPI003EED362B